ncbi:hypothetical protein L596_020208 [Steinernema carpocapsae]|uniref:MARVEL domain-containing protein n=1 Tax=Steinernema carpocapsae TaxID=34508 RepID=A0A4U5MSV4_STECR|nr:hypothetical protein L596_020208 [Steinernema carpocapsae]
MASSSSYASYEPPPGWRHSAVFSAEPPSSTSPVGTMERRSAAHREAHIGATSPLLYQPKRVDLPPLQKRREVPHPEFWYLSTGIGVCRIVETVCSLITFSLIVSVNAMFTPTYIAEITLLGMFFTSMILAMVYTFNIARTTEEFSWILFEGVYTCVAVYMSGITAFIMTYSAYRWQHNPWIFSVIFAYFTFFAFITDFVLVIKTLKKNPMAKHSDQDRVRVDDEVEMNHFDKN